MSRSVASVQSFVIKEVNKYLAVAIAAMVTEFFGCASWLQMRNLLEILPCAPGSKRDRQHMEEAIMRYMKENQLSRMESASHYFEIGTKHSTIKRAAATRKHLVFGLLAR